MRKSVLAAIAASCVACTSIVACSSSSDGGGGSSSGEIGSEAGSGNDTSTTNPHDDGGTGADGARPDGSTDLDGATPDDGGSPEPPGVRQVGRFDATGKFAYPGSKLVARFMGTDAKITFSDADGFSDQGHNWFDITVDGVLQTPIEVTPGTADYVVAASLPSAIHTVEVEKRTEGNLGVVTYGGFTFEDGANAGTLLSPPARPTRRIEILSDSTVDGFGVEGSRIAGSANYCNGAAPAQYDSAKKSMAEVTATTLSAESFLVAYSGKGLTVNEAASDNLYFPQLYGRTLPDVAGSTWDFTSWVPDAVVLSLGGVDFDGKTAEPAGFAAAYGGLVDTIRTNYPNAWIFLTVWSQVKDDTIPTRTAMKTSFNNIVAARAGDTKLEVFTFPMANVDVDETGCEYHGNATHEANMAALMAAEIKTKLGW